jgi:hypothetical protein
VNVRQLNCLISVRLFYYVFALNTVFIGYLQIIATSNYSVITNSHTLQFTTARTKFSQPAVSSPLVAW